MLGMGYIRWNKYELKNKKGIIMGLLGIRKYKTVGIKIIFALLLLSAVSCGENKEPVDINGKDVTEIVAEDVTKLFSESSRKYEISSVQTPENLFLEIAKRQIGQDVVLHPNLTYRITYRKWNLKTDQCDAMAYSVVRDGKLYGDGVVLSQSIIIGGVITNIIGYQDTFDVTLWLVILIIMVLFLKIMLKWTYKVIQNLMSKDARGNRIKVKGFGSYGEISRND
jgi:hypothetical protein